MLSRGRQKRRFQQTWPRFWPKQGASVILIDADLRNPGLTRSITGDVSEGIIDVLTAEANWRDIYYEE